jgi:NADH:ubiquinone oxidoreductase subunit D
MKAEVKQISDGISESLNEFISIDKINKNLEKTIKNSAKKIAKKVAKIRKKENKMDKKVTKNAIIKERLSSIKRNKSAKKVVVKKLPVVAKPKGVKLSIT